MLIPGLVSVTFRQLAPEEILSLATRAGLRSIEWGGDVHVPHGDTARARDVRSLTESAGLTCCSYASYYRLAHPDPVNPPFERVLDTAIALGTPLIRVWAGTLGSADAAPAHRAQVAADARRVCDLAQAAGVRVALEYHTRTLTDTNESAQLLLREAAHPNLDLLWQPTPGMDPAARLAGLRLALPRLANLHVYHYTGAAYAPLAELADEWRKYFAAARTTGRDHHCLLEFVRDDSPEAFLEDAATLVRLLNEPHAPSPSL
jgi:sugar phosphate isomerase/epimerase